MKRITVAVIGAPVGVRGSLRVIPHTASPSGFIAFKPLYLADRVMVITKARPDRDGTYIVDFVGIDTREKAAALRHGELTIAREQLPPPDEDEFYLADLIGLRVVGPEGQSLGVVVAVMSHGAGDILEIRPDGGGETEFYPFTRACVPDVDIAAGRLTLIAPD